jgi:exopolyphosphatase/guanosine-5'-triphosphate,3'-diphosphate pyrophosphatase
MTSSDEREEGVPGDSGVTAPDGDHTADKPEAKAAKRAAKKAARREAKAAKDGLKAAKREAKAQARASRDAAKSASQTEKKAAKAAQADARAQARAAKRAAKSEAKSARTLSPAVAHASAVLEEAAALIRQGEAPTADPDLESGSHDGSAAPAEAASAEPDPQPEAPEPVRDAEPAESADAEPADTAEAAPVPDAEPAELEPQPEPADAGADPDPESKSDGIAPEAEPKPESPAIRELTAGESPAALLAPVVAALRLSAPARAHVAAAIDVGATSVHLLVGSVDAHHVTPLLDESVFLGLGDRVGAAGYFGEELRAALVADLGRYIAAARELGATSVTIVGTEPMRRAADAPTVVAEVEAQSGTPFHVLDHAEEGLITLVGATGGSPVTGQLLLVDIGGGSSEFVVVGPGSQPRTMGLPLGASRLTRELVRSDPPSLAEIEALRRAVAAIVADAPDASPSEIVAVGGTSSNLLRLLPATAVDRSLTRRRIAVALAMLTVERSGEAATRHLIRPERARILPAGAIIVDAILEKYRADRLRVSEAGIREGAILAVARGGAAWRDQLATIARGWRDAGSGS